VVPLAAYDVSVRLTINFETENITMITQHTMHHRGKPKGQACPYAFRIQLSIKKTTEPQLKAAKFALEKRLGSSVSWTVFLTYAARALVESLEAKYDRFDASEPKYLD
jgi:hypothetical protein